MDAKDGLRVFNAFDKENKYKHKVITYEESSSLDNVEIVKFEDFVFDLEKET